MTDETKFVTTKIGSETWEPLHIDGARTGDIEWLIAPGDGQTLGAAVWRVLPGDAPESWDVEFHSDELMHVLEGRLEIDVVGGDTVVVGPGDVAVFPAGTKSTWRLLETPFKKVFMSA